MVGRLGKAVAVLIALGFVGLGFSMGMTAEQPDVQIQSYNVDDEEGVITATIVNQNPDQQVQLTLQLLENNQEINSQTFTMESGQAEKEIELGYANLFNPDAVHALSLSDESGEITRTGITLY
ncbi:hypothetical protein [Methanonatronarchaeum sp. AMET6-2]|uniref:hypothetical protein n=1 Tax=Methanonatronarchaeum sp. AMET6-2 TaxID=2933293 RepID=UPI0012237119|nr:hypothetical protein [Methanonatronarchaeum sp. AMET6-2]RZN63175.1 MAG: hypothetical protein EF811_00930 [Methanonatronarchaeia archaeon]UOY09461.1 hypothetical protein MU439_04195 [Methanonatronarchaeum sp. AMET6-2]